MQIMRRIVLVFAAVAGFNNNLRSAPRRRCRELLASADDDAPMSWASSMSHAPVLDDAIAEAAASVRAQLGAARRADLAIVHVSAAFEAAGQSLAGLAPAIERELPGVCALVGCASSAGVLSTGCVTATAAGGGGEPALPPLLAPPREAEDGFALALTAAALPGVELVPFALNNRLPDVSNRDAWRNLVGGGDRAKDGASDEIDDPALVLLYAAPSFALDDDSTGGGGALATTLAGVAAAYPRAAVLGGVAASSPGADIPGLVKRGALFVGGTALAGAAGDGLANDGAVGLCLRGDVRARAASASGVRAVGPPFVVSGLLEGGATTITRVREQDARTGGEAPAEPPMRAVLRLLASAAAARKSGRGEDGGDGDGESSDASGASAIGDDEAAALRRAPMVGLEQTRASVSAGDLAAALEIARRRATALEARNDADGGATDDDDDETRDSRARFESALRGESAPTPRPRSEDAVEGDGARFVVRAVSRVSMKDGSITLVGGPPRAPRGDAAAGSASGARSANGPPAPTRLPLSEDEAEEMASARRRDERLAGTPLASTGPRVGQRLRFFARLGGAAAAEESDRQLNEYKRRECVARTRAATPPPFSIARA